MVPSIELSDEAYAVLEQQRRAGESDSDAFLRLHRKAKSQGRDPAAFFRHPPMADLTKAQYDDFREKMRQADIKKAKDLYDDR